MSLLKDHLAQIKECMRELRESEKKIQEYAEKPWKEKDAKFNDISEINKVRNLRSVLWNKETTIEGAINALEDGTESFNQWLKDAKEDNFADTMQAESVTSTRRSSAVRGALSDIEKVVFKDESPEAIDIDNCIWHAPPEVIREPYTPPRKDVVFRLEDPKSEDPLQCVKIVQQRGDNTSGIDGFYFPDMYKTDFELIGNAMDKIQDSECVKGKTYRFRMFLREQGFRYSPQGKDRSVWKKII